ncbi:MAG: hypothetical protein KatS3mg006_0081 [Pyrinomonadaceae bacterium]|nr:MAG: hypothetical protein KatS3mg006_0081 [Pyrinomonadaceae bacterium]
MKLYFPVPKYNGNYKEGMAQFGWPRARGRLHAGCDLYAPFKSDVVAITDGIVVEVGDFYLGTQALAIRHEGIGVVRYGEIVEIPESFYKVGAKVKAGDIIGKVGQVIKISAMVHLELFDGTKIGPLTDRTKGIKYYNDGVKRDGNYQRRADLMNPTKLLDRLLLEGIR